MTSLPCTICIKSLWKNAYVSSPATDFIPVYPCDGVWRCKKTILFKGMLLSNSPYAVPDSLLDLVGDCFVFLTVADDPQQPHTVIMSLQDFQLQV